MTELFAPLASDNSDTLKSYFDFVLKAERSGEEFSVDFELVWPLAYAHKSDAKKALMRDFFDGEDYQIRHIRNSPDVVRPQGGGTQPEEIRLTPKCLEFFIARKVRSIFEIYRQCRIAVSSAPTLPSRMHPPLPPSHDTSALENAIARFIEANGVFMGTPTQLLLELSRIISDSQFQAPDWPHSPQSLGVALSRAEAGLNRCGIEVKRTRTGIARMVCIWPSPTRPRLG